MNIGESYFLNYKHVFVLIYYKMFIIPFDIKMRKKISNKITKGKIVKNFTISEKN